MYQSVYHHSFQEQSRNYRCTSLESRGGGSRPPKFKKMNVFRQKINAIWAKANHTNFICT